MFLFLKPNSPGDRVTPLWKVNSFYNLNIQELEAAMGWEDTVGRAAIILGHHNKSKLDSSFPSGERNGN